MVDRIRKILRELSPKELKQLTGAVKKIQQNDLISFDIKKLQGRDDVYRVRKGNFRIIFRKVSDGENVLLAIERRSDRIYRNF